MLKLPSDMQSKWADYKATINDGTDVTVFARWLFERATNLFNAIPKSPSHYDYKQKVETRPAKKKDSVNVHHGASTGEAAEKCLTCNETCFSVAKCPSFAKATLDQR